MRFSLSKQSIFSLLEGWVSSSITFGTPEHAEHSRFIGLNLMVAAASLAGAPVLLAFERFFPESLILQAGLSIGPLLIANWVSTTGKLEQGKIAALFGLAFSVAIATAAAELSMSIALLFLIVVPIEATLWRCKNALATGAIVTIVGLIVTLTFGGAGTTVPPVAVSQWVAVIALVYGAFVAWRVHHAQQTALKRLDQKTAHLNAVSQSSTDLITRHGRDGTTLFASPAARTLMGVHPKELTGAGLFEKTHLQDRILFLKAISDAAHSGRDQECEIRLRTKGETDLLWKKVRVTARAISDSTTGSTEVACSIRDISRERDLELELEQVSRRSDEFSISQRQFLAKMSHELRTPLNAIVGFSDVLQQELFGKLPHERHHEYVSLIQESGQHLLNVVNDLLDMSRIEAGKYELSLSTFSIQSVLSSTINMLHPLADKKSVEIACDLSAGFEDITADRRACQQILINLVSNAIKFSNTGDKVRIKVKPFGRSFKIQVVDRGVGIASDFLPKVGQPFVQADTGNNRQFEGSGLGLSVVKGLVDLHHGEFKIQSVEGEGTTVTVTLPIHSRASRPVPGNADNQLVRLDKVSAVNSENSKPVTSSVNKGDSRARLSA